MPAGTRSGLLTTFATAILPAVLPLASAAAVSSSIRTDFLEITTYETEQTTSPTAENAHFVKYVTVDPVGITEAVTVLAVWFPGRAFIDFVDSYLDAGGFANSSTLAQIEISADVYDLVDKLKVSSGKYEELIDIDYDSEFRDEGDAAGHLLVQISVIRANAVRSIYVSGTPSVEVVINDGVVNSLNELDLLPEYSSRYFNNITSSIDTEAERNDSLDIFVATGTKLFLRLSSTQLNLFSLDLHADEESSMYIDVGNLVVSNGMPVSADTGGIIVAHFESAQVDFLGVYTDDSSSICVDATDSLETNGTLITDPHQVTLPGLVGDVKLSGATTCSFEPIPSRVPRDIRLLPNGSSVPSSSEGSTSTDTSSTAGSASPSQDNAVSMVEYSRVAMLLIAFVTFELSAS
jgi:hypothetical protein